jgi:hypothetical protein
LEDVLNMRNRVLTYTNKGKLLAIADDVTKLISADKATDSIPPDYNCDGERLVVVVVKAKASYNDSVRRVISNFNRGVTANVAFIVDGTPETVQPLLELTKECDANIMKDKILYINGGLPFKFIKKVTPEERETVKAWCEDILANLK